MTLNVQNVQHTYLQSLTVVFHRVVNGFLGKADQINSSAF